MKQINNKNLIGVISLLFFSATILLLLFSDITHAKSAQVVLSENQGLVSAWKLIIGIANSFVILILIVVAFSEILRIQIDTYAIKKILPTLIWAIVAANFSFLVCRILVDFSNAGISAFLDSNGSVSTFKTIVEKGRAYTWTPGLQNIAKNLFFALIENLFQLALALGVGVLAFLFFIRNYVIYFLVVVSPLAFMAIALPVTKKFFDQWLSMYLKWVFLPISSVFMLWLAGVFLSSLDDTPLLQIAFCCVCVYGAIMVPFQLGGPIMQKWGGAGKKALGGLATVTGAKSFAQHQQGRATNWARRTGVGKFFEGRAAKGRFNIQQEKDMGEKLAEGAEKKVYGTAKRDLEKKKATMAAAGQDTSGVQAQLLRINSRIRKWTQEEVAGYQGKDPADLLARLESLGFTTGGRLINKDAQLDLLANKTPDYFEGAAILGIIQRQRTNSATREAATATIRNMLNLPVPRGTTTIDDYVKGNDLSPAERDKLRAFNSGEPGMGFPATSNVGTPVNTGQAGTAPGSSSPQLVEVTKIHDKQIEDALAHLNNHTPEMERLAGVIHDGGIEGYDRLKQELSGSGAASVVERLNPGLGDAGAEEIAAALAKYKTAVEMMDHAPQHLERIERGEVQQGLADIRKSLEQSAATSAANAAIGNVAANHLSGKEGTINSITGNEDVMRELASTMGELHASIDGLKDRPTLDHKELAVVMKEAMVGMVPKGGNGGNTSLSSLMGNSEADKRRFADTLGKAVAKHTAAAEARKPKSPPPSPTL